MHQLNFDIAFLRSYVAGIELGSFARAADKVGRSTSAVSAQLKKLEEQAGMPLFRKDGRGLALTPAGEVLLGYARRLLELALLVAQFKVHGPAPYLRLMVVLTLPTEAASVNQRWVIVCVCV